MEDKNTQDKESHLIEQLEKELYLRHNDSEQRDRTVLHPKKFKQTEEAWGQESLDFKKQEEKESASPFVKFFLFSFVFFLITAGIVAYSLFNKRIVVSPNNVEVSLFGPVSIKGGEELALQVSIDNKNKVSLNNVQLTADFPDGSRYANNPEQRLTRLVKKLDNIEGDEVRTDTVKAFIFGKENDKKEITLVVRFSVEGSDAQYTKTKKFLVNITTPPLSFTVNTLHETTDGQDFVFAVDVKSNSSALLNDALFKIEYPKGFVYGKATPAPSQNNNTWALGDMNVGESKHIEITGKLVGENDQEKVFHLMSGVGTKTDKLSIETLFSQSLTPIVIKKPFLGINLFVNGKNIDDPIIQTWKDTKIGVVWTNSLLNKIIDGEIEVTLDGAIIDKRTVASDMNGFYDSFKNTIFWDQRVVPSLTSLAPGQKGVTNFSFSFVPYSALNPITNPVVTITTSVKGKRVDENNVPEAINFFSTKNIKIDTQMSLAADGTYYAGPIVNHGPIPPKVGNETTYTITWKMANTVNNISEAEMSAIIPLGVKFTGVVFPANASLSYNDTSHKVVWTLGKIKNGKGYLDDPATVSFQVALIPGLSQLQKSPSLLTKTLLTATDDFTGDLLSREAPEITTVINNSDSSVNQTGIKVVE